MPVILQKHNTQIEFWKLLPGNTHTSQAYRGISVSQENSSVRKGNISVL